MEETESLDKDIALLDSLAEQYSLVWEISTAEIKPVVRGSNGFIYCYDEARKLLGCAFIPDDLPGDGWNTVCHAAIAAGMVLIRDSLHESYIAFSPKNDRQCQIAMSVAGIKPTADSAAQRATMCDVITKARARKQRQVEHQKVLKRVSLIRAGADLSDYDPTFQPGSYHLTI